jgi:hypothetical protein
MRKIAIVLIILSILIMGCAFRYDIPYDYINVEYAERVSKDSYSRAGGIR